MVLHCRLVAMTMVCRRIMRMSMSSYYMQCMVHSKPRKGQTDGRVVFHVRKRLV